MNGREAEKRMGNAEGKKDKMRQNKYARFREREVMVHGEIRTRHQFPLHFNILGGRVQSSSSEA
jgi:hypothetical protein